jgi:hypothetical protein
VFRKSGRLALVAAITAATLLLASCASSDPQAGAIRLRNFNLGKSISKGMSEASGAISGAVNDVGGAITGGFAEASTESTITGRTAASSITSTYRNAQGQIVDAANNVITMIPLTWPAYLDSGAITTTVKSLQSTFPQVLSSLEGAGKSLKGLSASDAQNAINDVLQMIGTPNPPVQLPGFNSTPVPVASHLYVKIRPSQWTSSYSANLQIDLDFFGIKSYKIGFGCLGFPDGFTEKPRLSLDGGCDNPWKLAQSASVMQSSAKSVVGDMSKAITGLTSQMTGIMANIAKGASNPRDIPPMALDIPINQLLSEITPGFPSSSAAKKAPAESADDAKSNSAASDAVSGMAQSAAMQIAVPQLGGLSFEMAPDLSPVAYIDDRWTKNGQIEFGVELGMFGMFTAGVKMGCLTFGTSWKTKPSITFNGGCDNSWNVDFTAGSYTSSSYRIDHRATNGSAGGPAIAPPVPAYPSAAPAGVFATGGTVSTITQNGIKYAVHTFTINDDSTFFVPDAMSGVPMEYLVIGGGGAGSSIQTTKQMGAGGGGAGGILTNLGGSPLRLLGDSYLIIVGAGGTGPFSSSNGLNGGNSSIGGTGIVALGGGGGGHLDSGGSAGGSGGGAGSLTGKGHSFPGSGTVGTGLQAQGNDGGPGFQACKNDACSAGGGGGGWGSGGGGAQSASSSGGNGGVGGAGNTSAITGTSVVYAAGGGGGALTGGAGGSGIGGNGGNGPNNGSPGADNTGSGGGGAASGNNQQTVGGNGGSGIVIIRYPIS